MIASIYSALPMLLYILSYLSKNVHVYFKTADFYFVARQIACLISKTFPFALSHIPSFKMMMCVISVLT